MQEYEGKEFGEAQEALARMLTSRLMRFQPYPELADGPGRSGHLAMMGDGRRIVASVGENHIASTTLKITDRHHKVLAEVFYSDPEVLDANPFGPVLTGGAHTAGSDALRTVMDSIVVSARMDPEGAFEILGGERPQPRRW